MNLKGKRLIDGQLSGDELYLLTDDGEVMVLSLSSSSSHLSSEPRRIGAFPGARALSVSRGRVVIRTRKGIALADLKGRELWRAEVGITLKGKPAVDSSDTVYVRDRYDRLFSARQGRVIARFKLGKPISDPVSIMGHVYVCSPRRLYELGSVPPEQVLQEEARRAGLTMLPAVLDSLKLPIIGRGRQLLITGHDPKTWLACLSPTGAVMIDLSSPSSKRAELLYRFRTYSPSSTIPAYLIRQELRRRFSSVSRPTITYGRLHTYVAGLRDKVSGVLQARLDTWRENARFLVSRGDGRTVTAYVHHYVGTLYIAEREPSGLVRTDSWKLFSLIEVEVYDDLTYSLIAGLLGLTAETEDERFWRSIALGRGEMRLTLMGGKPHLLISAWRRTLIIPLEI